MNEQKPPSLWQVAKSVLAAGLGVQKYENYERDFTHGKPSQYIIIGLVFVVIFILVIITIVKTVLSFAGVS